MSGDTRPHYNPNAAGPAEVCFHAWKYDDERNQEYCAASEGPDGWCGYVRTAGNELIGEELDFPTYEAAQAWADATGAELGVEVRLF
jgi:hypothetical protein